MCSGSCTDQINIEIVKKNVNISINDVLGTALFFFFFIIENVHEYEPKKCNSSDQMEQFQGLIECLLFLHTSNAVHVIRFELRSFVENNIDSCNCTNTESKSNIASGTVCDTNVQSNQFPFIRSSIKYLGCNYLFVCFIKF